jgi:hypothetical protein
MTSVVAAMDADTARALTDEVKDDAQALWTKLLALYEGGAHTALGYPSWGGFYEAEFSESAGRGYQLIRSAGVVRALGDCTSVHPPSEAVARELAPLRAEPGQLREAWTEAVQTHGPSPTATQVREVVAAHKPAPRDVHAEFAAIDPAVATAVAVRDSNGVLARVQSHIFDLRRIDIEACAPVLDAADRDRLKRLTDDCDRALGEIASLRDAAVQRLRPVRKVS